MLKKIAHAEEFQELKMSNSFFDHSILNSPYNYPARYWELDENGNLISKNGVMLRIRKLLPAK